MQSCRLIAVLLFGASNIGLSLSSAQAQTNQAMRRFDLPSQDLSTSLRAAGRLSETEIIFRSETVGGKVAPALHGTMTVTEAVRRLLAGSGLSANVEGNAIVIREETPDVVVTGTNIRGASVTSQTITVSRADIRNAGQGDLGEVARSVPQNFAGGQNPGVGSGAGLINSNLNSASQLNLRGLGPDATLTLLNGHRLPYDGVFGGIDISAIPVAAVERIEIVADGSSAQYGSDAVAGVVNVILRRDFTGLATSARIGSSTDGGDFQQGADVVGGTNWGSGGLIAAYQFARNSAISARQRDYAGTLPQGNSLYPSIRQHSVTVSGHQTITPGVEFHIDGLFSDRSSTTISGNQSGAGLTQYRFAPTARSFSITPEIDVTLPGQWLARASLAYGKDDSHYNTLITPPGGTGATTSGCYCNSALTAEIVFDGPVFTLPGGDLRLALGGGLRSNSMRYSRFQDGTSTGAFDVSRKSHYIFGEAQVPLIGPGQEVPFVHRLTLTAAARYENYPGMASVTTPKLGILFEPNGGITIRGSWGRSFKAPTLYQQYVGYETYLLPARAYVPGAAGTVLYASGGNPDLKPERARSWSVGLEFHPAAVAGLKFGVSYFNVQYRDRVTQPIAGSIASAFADPGYASLLTYGPSPTYLNTLVAGALYGLANYSGAPFDPNQVYALIDNRNRNVARQTLEGVDLDFAYRFAIGAERNLSLTGSATYLRSDQLLTSLLPATQLAGSVFNPPHWRGRAGLVWEARRVTLSAFGNYIGSVTDARFVPASTIHSVTTFDAVGRVNIGGASPEKPVASVALVINNLFNAKPDVIRTSGSSDTPYDSTNYSPIGRYIGLTVARNW